MLKNNLSTLEWLALCIIIIICSLLLPRDSDKYARTFILLAIASVGFASGRLEHIKSFYKNIKSNFIRLKPEIKVYCIIVLADSILSILLCFLAVFLTSYNKEFIGLLFQSKLGMAAQIFLEVAGVALELVSLFIILSNIKWKIVYTRILLVLASVNEIANIPDSGIYFYNILKLIICVYFVIYFFKLHTTFKDAVPSIDEQHTVLTDSHP